MFCGNCGTTIEENVGFCPNCGAKIESSQPSEVKVEQVQPQVETNNMFVNNNPDNFNNEPEQKKKKFSVVKLLCIVIPALIIVATIILNMGTIAGFAVKTFGSDSDYFRYVEAKAIGSYSDSLASLYGNVLLENADMKFGQTTEATIELSDEGKDTLSDLTDVDMEWLDKVKIDLEANVDGMQSAKAGVTIGKTDIATVDFISDLEGGMIYFAIPEISEQYLGAEVDTEEYKKLMSELENLKETLPSKAKLAKTVTKYSAIAFNSIDDAKIYDESIKVGGIKQDCDVIELDIDERLILEMQNNVLEEAKTDEELQTMIADFVDVLASTDSSYEDVDVNKFFSEDIDELQNDIQEQLDALDGDGEVLYTLTDYVNGKHEIIGRSLTAYDEEVLFMGKAKKGGDVAYELRFEDAFAISGEGKERGNKISGTFEVSAEDEEILIVETDKFDISKLFKGELIGSFKFELSSSMANAVDNEELGSLLDYALEVKCGKTSIDLKLTENDNELLSVAVNSKKKSPDKIETPSEDLVVNVENQDDLKDYIGSANTDAIIDNLREAKIPDELMEPIEEAVDSLKEMAKY